MEHHSLSSLPEQEALRRKWGESIVTGMGLVCCKGKKAARKKPADSKVQF